MKRGLKSIIISIVGIIMLINAICFKAYAKDNERIINFKRITIEDGLSQTTAQYIFQDSKGYMWIGTSDGLNRYDGYEFQVYRYKEGDTKSLSGNYISAINEDKYGNIWIGTSRGLNKINKKTQEIKSYFPGRDDCNLSDYNITEILLDSNDDIYISTTNGLNLYDEENDNFIRLYNEDDDNKLTSEFIYSIAEDKNKNLWIGTKDGLNKIDRETNKITNYYADGSSNSITDDFIYSLYVDDLNNLWIGTYNGGLNKLNIDTNKIEYYLHDSNNSYSIASNSIRDIIVDAHGITWVATSDGLSRLNNNDYRFINYKSKVYDSQSVVSDNILNLYEDNSGSIWIGTYDGISIVNLENAFVNYRKDPFDDNSLSDNMLAGIYKDNDGFLWVGTVYNGLNVMDRENNIIKKYRATEEDNSLSNDNIRAITGIDNEIWIATENGLTKYDKKEDKFTKYFLGNDDTLVCNDIRSLFIDSDGVLWLATVDGVYTFDRKDKIKSYKELFKRNGITETMFSEIIEDKDGVIWIGSSLDGGLIKLNKKTEEIKVYRNNIEDANSLSFNIVSSIAVDEYNNIWVGTQYGLNKFNRENENFTRYTEENGLSNNFIYGVLVDNDDDLWISTNYGISKYDVDKNKFINYDVTDGLQGNEFNGFSYYKAKDGELFFGGINGLTAFYPQELKEKSFLPNVVIGSVNINDRKILNFDDISLNYKSNNINFKFFLPDYGNMKKIQYQYKLVGLDDNWIFSDSRNYVNYTNLDSGKYTFMVRARNSTGEWSEATSIDFTISKKPWKTSFAYMIYGLIIFLVIYIIWNRVKILDSLVEQRTIELNKKLKENEELYNKLIQNEKYKNNYFINLSHELRTPLNVIISVEQLISKLNSDNKEIPTKRLEYYMGTLRRNSKRLLNLINNIIDTSKIESGSYKLDIKEHDIVFLVEETALSMKDYIEANEIQLIIDPEIEEKVIECDDNEIEKCIVNLIGNAVKFTQSGGEIEVKIKDFNEYVQISVKDTGVGIDKKYHKAIFNRFGQAYNDITEENGGSGLGLTLTKQIVNLHGGKIYVESEVNKGSEFVIILPNKQDSI